MNSSTMPAMTAKVMAISLIGRIRRSLGAVRQIVTGYPGPSGRPSRNQRTNRMIHTTRDHEDVRAASGR